MAGAKGIIDIRSIEPTEVVAEFTFTTNGGVIDGERFKRVQRATVNAFQQACIAEGLDYSAEMSLSCRQPAAFEKWAAKKFGEVAR